MLYYRTKAGIGGGRPPELDGYQSPGPGMDLQECVIDGHRVMGVSPPFRFDPPTAGWVPLDGSPGWQVVSVGDFDPISHIKLRTTWSIAKVVTGGVVWLIPHVLNTEGTRAFKVSYGGPDFCPILTPEQTMAEKLAKEIRTAIDADNLPDMPIRARWAARLLPLAYCLSESSLAVLGMSEDLIDATLRVAAGLYAINER
jgi:hypothetical protein